MRKLGVFVSFALSMTVQGACAWWAAAARGIEPIILSFGALFAAIGLNDMPKHDILHSKTREWFDKENYTKIKGEEQRLY